MGSHEPGLFNGVISCKSVDFFVIVWLSFTCLVFLLMLYMYVDVVDAEMYVDAVDACKRI